MVWQYRFTLYIISKVYKIWNKLPEFLFVYQYILIFLEFPQKLYKNLNKWKRKPFNQEWATL